MALRDVSKVFRGTLALDRCSLEIAANGFSVVLHDGRPCRIEGNGGGYPALALVGPNGAGKTTLLNVLCGYLAPDSGALVSDALEVVAGRAIREIGRSFQEPKLWDRLSVYENLLLGALRQRSWRELRRPIAADDVAAEAAVSLASRLGLLGELEKDASELSFGKRKVLDIGVAVASRPQILVLDEPTAGVSPKELAELEALVREMTRWAPVVLVEHNLDAIRRLALPVLFMAEGRLLECGPLDEVLGRKSVREQFSGLQAREE